MNKGFIDIIFIIVPILIVIGFVFTFLMLFSSKMRAKIMGIQVKTMKHMINQNKNDLVDIGSDVGDIITQTGENILDQNEIKLKKMSDKIADINREGIKTTVHAIKEGWDAHEVKYCHNCGQKIDAAAIYCQKCGTKL